MWDALVHNSNCKLLFILVNSVRFHPTEQLICSGTGISIVIAVMSVYFLHPIVDVFS